MNLIESLANKMVKKSSLKINCPHCNKVITLDDALTNQLENEIKTELNKKHESELNKIKSEILSKDKEFESLKESVDKQIDKALKEERKNIEKDAEKHAKESISITIKDLENQISEKTKKLDEAEKNELDFRKQKRDLEEAQNKFQLEMERKLDDERKKIYDETSKKIIEEHHLKDIEKDKQMGDLKKQIDELKRKSEQGSQKNQGESLEIELERILKEKFYEDEIEAIASGVNGADILQRVCLKSGKVCGSILIESKNTKNWNNTWIPKLKKDQREKKADIAVIITNALPTDINTFEFQNGVMIVQFNHSLPVISLLRNQLFEVSRIAHINEGKNEKQDILYKYVTSIEFKQKVESMVEAFSGMINDLQKEKRAMTKLWSKREMQIEQAITGIAGIHGGMHGILGSAMPEVKNLEFFDESNDDFKDENNE
ncbi:MAG: DUF2130 domain-containing protein [Candidatus Nanoarchaeia archaeon]|nr:DUF2130 domain-containing protein [Candidatus Nanoarchaeia archaeon]